MYRFLKCLTILSYVSPKNEVVIAVSSVLHTTFTDEGIDKPEIVVHYSLTKGEIDAKVH